MRIKFYKSFVKFCISRYKQCQLQYQVISAFQIYQIYLKISMSNRTCCCLCLSSNSFRPDDVLCTCTCMYAWINYANYDIMYMPLFRYSFGTHRPQECHVNMRIFSIKARDWRMLTYVPDWKCSHHPCISTLHVHVQCMYLWRTIKQQLYNNIILCYF